MQSIRIQSSWVPRFQDKYLNLFFLLASVHMHLTSHASNYFVFYFALIVLLAVHNPVHNPTFSMICCVLLPLGFICLGGAGYLNICITKFSRYLFSACSVWNVVLAKYVCHSSVAGMSLMCSYLHSGI